MKNDALDARLKGKRKGKHLILNNMSIKILTPPFAAYEVILAYFLINVNSNYIFYAYFQCKKKGPAVTVGACGANYFLLPGFRLIEALPLYFGGTIQVT